MAIKTVISEAECGFKGRRTKYRVAAYNDEHVNDPFINLTYKEGRALKAEGWIVVEYVRGRGEAQDVAQRLVREVRK